MKHFEALKNLNISHSILKMKNTQTRRDYIRELITRELVYEWVITYNKSIYSLECELKKLGIHSVGAVRRICIENDIETPNSSESAHRSMLQRQATMMNTYGVINISQCEYIKAKKASTFIDHYGVDNIFKQKEFKDSIPKRMFNKYGVTHQAHRSDHSYGKNLSKPHLKISGMLNSMNIEHENEKSGMFTMFNENMNKIYSPRPDITIPSLKLVIEVYGDYYHANPYYYKSSDLISLRWISKEPILVSDIWKKDSERKAHIENFDYTVIELWERDINTMDENQLRSVIYDEDKSDN